MHKSTVFWVPRPLPQPHYATDARIDPDAGVLEGNETIRLTHTGSQPLGRLALACPASCGADDLRVTAWGEPVQVLPPHPEAPGEQEQRGAIEPGAPLALVLPHPLEPGADLQLEVGFRSRLTAPAGARCHLLTRWHPQLWWGVPGHSSFSVRLQVPDGYAVATSGRFDPISGRYDQDGLRSFGLFLGRDHRIAEAEAGDTLVRCVYTPAGQTCAEMLLATAVDAVAFYRDWLGFFPFRSLALVPGADQPMGGYPVAGALVAIHGQERFADKPALHWRWITAHEIGHQYWGEYVLDKDDPPWLWLGLGLYADRQYLRARGLADEPHRRLVQRYLEGVQQGLDTTVQIPPEQLPDVGFDRNNVVEHGKGFAIVSALDCLLGSATFERAYRRCLRQFGGCRLGAIEFQQVCEEESQQDLEWFFGPWLCTNQYPAYQIASTHCTGDGPFRSEVRVVCRGTLRLPVPVQATFEDETRQVQWTDPLLDTECLFFGSTAPLRAAVIDPEGALPLVWPLPLPTLHELRRALEAIPWTGVDRTAILDLFHRACAAAPHSEEFWGILGLKTYDAGCYDEALEAFRRVRALARPTSIWAFTAAVWQGHLLDLLGRRVEAVQCYQRALELDTGETMEHSNYQMVLSADWVRQRLVEPFTRP